MKSIKLPLILLLTINFAYVRLSFLQAYKVLNSRVKSDDKVYDDSCKSSSINPASKSYVTDIKFISSKDAIYNPCTNGFSNVPGSDENPADLNRRTIGGNYVYMCQKIQSVQDDDSFVNDFKFAQAENNIEQLINRLQNVEHYKNCDNTNLNDGAKGGLITKMCWSTTKGVGTIKGISSFYISTNWLCPSDTNGYICHCEINLNKGTVIGSNIWLCYKKE